MTVQTPGQLPRDKQVNVHLPCNNCGSRSHSRFLDAHDQKTGNPDHRLHLVKCNECELVFLSPQPDAQVAEQYFHEVYTGERSGGRYQAYYHDLDALLRKAAIRVNWIAKRSGSLGRLLDVGAGRGHFVKAASDAGWMASGVELDDAACEFARTTFNADVQCGILDEHRFAGEVFDAITLWDLIEHVDDPRDLLATTYQSLRKGGRIFIRTGNVDSWEFRRSPSEWSMLFSGHLYYFSPHSLSMLLKDIGFRSVVYHDSRKIDRAEQERRPRASLETVSVWDGMKAMAKSPAKLKKLPVALKQKLEYKRVRREFPASWDISIMVVEAQR